MSDSVTPPDGVPPTSGAHPGAAVFDRAALRASLLIGLCCLVIYNANFRSISAGDTYPARYLPFAILQYHTLSLNPVAKVAAQGRGAGAYWIVTLPDGRLMSTYPVALPVLIAPLYLPAVGYLHLRGWTDARLDHLARVMEKLAASLLAALSVALLYLLLLRRAKAPDALLLTLAYAFGTTTWVISSQALWQHGMAGLLLIGALLLLTGPCTVPRIFAAGLLLGLIAANRPPDLILAVALGIYGLLWAGRRRGALLAVAAALPMLLVLLYNLREFGSTGGGYGRVGKTAFFQHDLLAGVSGVLVSPTRGLFVFSPFLLFLVLAWRHWPRSRDERRLTVAMIAGIVLEILLYAKTDWRAGLSWGPRYMTDFLPLFIWMLVPVVTALRGVGRRVFLFAACVAVAIEAIGAFTYTGSVDLPIYAADSSVYKQDMHAAFQWRNAPFVASLKQGLAPADLAVSTRGSFDGIETTGGASSVITAGQEAFAAGWALAGNATPAQVAVMIDGVRTVASSAFFDRSDVRGKLHVTSPAGWRIPLDTAALAPGEHHLTAFVWAFVKGEGHYLEERTLTVQAPAASRVATPAVVERIETPPADLVEDFRNAAARIREHQQAPGYWLTAYTSETRFHEPRPEMNTFLTALLVDLMDPLAAASGLEESLQRARHHLTSQIESGGLVRYHGLPNGPGIGTLGCAITPDTDNTALVWRLAPGSDRGQLGAALATIDKYRTREGLYRTWLAPREAYQCLDPGRDPNPADIAIQMHLLLLLSKVRPAAGRALCEALRPLVDEDRVWVYYRKTPLIPILRLPDLRRAGCALELPESRMRTDVPGQQIWVSVVRMLGDGMTPGSAPDATLMRAAMRELARDDFALIRMNPPLLYHNDLTATVSRYYWSEDVGYALWLRLYDRYEHAGDLGR